VLSEEIVSSSVGSWANAAEGSARSSPKASGTIQSTFRLIVFLSMPAADRPAAVAVPFA
jgi:hypothetical protein